MVPLACVASEAGDPPGFCDRRDAGDGAECVGRCWWRAQGFESHPRETQSAPLVAGQVRRRALGVGGIPDRHGVLFRVDAVDPDGTGGSVTMLATSEPRRWRAIWPSSLVTEAERAAGAAGELEDAGVRIIDHQSANPTTPKRLVELTTSKLMRLASAMIAAGLAPGNGDDVVAREVADELTMRARILEAVARGEAARCARAHEFGCGCVVLAAIGELK